MGLGLGVGRPGGGVGEVHGHAQALGQLKHGDVRWYHPLGQLKHGGRLGVELYHLARVRVRMKVRVRVRVRGRVRVRARLRVRARVRVGRGDTG